MSLSANVSEKAALIWAIADKLTGVYKPHEYGEVILPLTVIRRFDCILAATNDRLKGENDALRSELKDFRFLRKVLGSRQIDNLIAQAKEMEQQRKQNQRTKRRNTNYER